MSTKPRNFIIDLSGYKDRSGGRAAEGPQNVVIEDFEVGETSGNNGKPKVPMFTVFFRVEGGEDSGTTIVDRLVQSEGAMFRTANFMKALGLSLDRRAYSFSVDQFIGKRMTIEVADGDPYNGTIRSEVRSYSPRRGGAGAQKEEKVDDLELPADEPAAEPEPKPEPKPEPAAEAKAESVAEETLPIEEKPAAQPSAQPETIDLDSIDLG